MLTKAQIGCWFDKGVKQGFTHLLVILDEFEFESTPVYAKGDGDAIKLFTRFNGVGLQRVSALYDLRESKADQLSQMHVMRLPVVPA